MNIMNAWVQCPSTDNGTRLICERIPDGTTKDLIVVAILCGLAPCGVFGRQGDNMGFVKNGVQFDGNFYSYPGFDDPREVEYMTTITREVTTPHLPTAVPYSLGPTRVLFICPRFAARPTVELCQRFSIQERHALVARERALSRPGRENMFGSPGDSAEEVQESLRQGLSSKPEVVVVYDFAWRLLPEELRRQVVGMVQSLRNRSGMFIPLMKKNK